MQEQPFTLAIGGGELHGHLAGAGWPALLLHGGPAVPDYTDACAAALEGLFATIRYTQRGTLPSTGGPPYSIESHMDDALAVLDHFGLEQAWVVGHSWGGHLALHLAVAHPERVLGLVLIDPLGAVDVFEEFFERLSANLSSEQTARIREIEERRRRGEVTEAELIERYELVWPKYFADPAVALPLPANLGVQCSAETNVSIREHLERGTLTEGVPRVRVPTLFVHGEDDVLPLHSSTATAELMPGAVVEIIPGAGHFPWLEKPDEFRAAVERFLDQLG